MAIPDWLVNFTTSLINAGAIRAAVGVAFVTLSLSFLESAAKMPETDPLLWWGSRIAAGLLFSIGLLATIVALLKPKE